MVAHFTSRVIKLDLDAFAVRLVNKFFQSFDFNKRIVYVWVKLVAVMDVNNVCVALFCNVEMLVFFTAYVAVVIISVAVM